MGKTWAAVALVLLAVGPAAVRADDPAIRRLTRQHDTFGSEYLPAPQAVSPPVPRGPAAAPTEDSPPPAAPAALPAAPAACPAGGPCCGCCAPAEEPHQHFACIHKLINWLSYCPLKKGVNCEPCGCDGHGDCCCYHCFPPPYLFLMQPCVDGHAPSMPCWGCSSCGGTHPVQAGASSAAGGSAPPAAETPSATPAANPTAGQTPPPDDGARRGYFGQRHRLLSLSSGFGYGSVGSR
jgi:hypothetical protein